MLVAGDPIGLHIHIAELLPSEGLFYPCNVYVRNLRIFLLHETEL
jgi:hypothetical protein